MDLRHAIAGALEESLLRATDGTEWLSQEQALMMTNELLWGEGVWPSGFEMQVRARYAALRMVEVPVPARDRRPAPTVQQAWEASPDAHALHLRALADPEQRKWALVAQPLYSLDTPWEDLPARIVRQCCQGKSCGGTGLIKHRTDTPTGTVFAYRRDTNEETLFADDTISGLIAQINDAATWPNRCDLTAFTSAGEDGWDVAAPNASA